MCRLNGGSHLFKLADVLEMNTCDRSVLVEIKVQYILVLPVFKRPENILLGIIKSVSYITHGCLEMCIHHAYKVKIYLELRIVCIRHVIVDEPVGKDRRVDVAVLIDC